MVASLKYAVISSFVKKPTQNREKSTNGDYYLIPKIYSLDADKKETKRGLHKKYFTCKNINFLFESGLKSRGCHEWSTFYLRS